MRPVTSVRLLSLIALIAVDLAGTSLLQAEAPSAPRTRLLESYGRLPLHFESNQGQVDSQVKFLARGSGYSLFLTPTEAVLALGDRGASGPAVVRLKLEGANPGPYVTGRDELPGKINYFVGSDPARWRTNIATFARVQYRGVYPGIDLVYYGNQRQLEYDFVVAPGADPGRIRMSFDGARDVRIDASGDLILHAAGGDLRQHKPVVYQDVQGVRQQIPGRYVMKGSRRVGFELGVYDDTRPLVIDPILVYSTYLGGASTDEGNDIAVDAAGNAYVTGQTNSSDFRTTRGAFDTAFSGIAGTNLDAFVTKLDFTGSTLVYSTFLGGSGNDGGSGVAIDASGNAYVTGSTTSDGFPVTAGAFDTVRNGQDAFVAKLNDTGSALLYSTFLGGGQADVGNDVAVDADGNAYVTGQTFSSTFPTTVDAFDTSGTADAFVTKLNVAGSDLAYSTYLGGSNRDMGNGIAVDAAGNAYVTGRTLSTDFPTSADAFDSTGDGTDDVFVTKLNPAGSGLMYSTYLGGSGPDSGNDVAVDALFNAHVTGQTSSNDFPTTPGAFQAAHAGEGDAFVTTVGESGGALLASTYLGGSGSDIGNAIAVDAAGNAYVTGQTLSSDFPTMPGAFQPALNGTDAVVFVTTLNPAASELLNAIYLGGSGTDSGNGIALDAVGNAYVTGSTGSSNLPATPGAFQTSANGGQDAFVAKIGARVPASLTLDPSEAIDPVHSEHCVTATVEDAAGNPVPRVTVRFTIIGAANTRGSETTDEGGRAMFCYTGPVTQGADAISAFADTNKDGTQDVAEPSGRATKTWVPGAPATLTLTPPSASNPIGTQQCVTATLTDAFGNATPGITVHVYVTGAVTTSGSATTDASGEGDFCYAGPPLPGADTITAYADSNNDGGLDAGEPTGTAVKTWLPATAAECKVTGGGYITTVTGGRAMFAGNAWSQGDMTGGKQEYYDRGREPRMRVRSLNVLGVVCRSSTEATIFGEALVNDSSRVQYRIDVKDMGEPGHGNDWYSIQLSNGYTSGEQILKGGNIQIH